ncbi:FliO/MopB family protein [Pseudolabrys taiwanensis]|nr:flagellar biosynthetic protein FliO [Pseudolabrys taiwanensis]
MFESLFGSEMPLAARFFIAFLVVLGLIGVTAWLVRRFGASRLGGAGARGRQPRLAVIDAATVDGRRRLVLIRRDNIEHLLMIGGPTDVVVEQNIVRAAGREATLRETGRTELRAAQPETAWPLQPLHEPAPVAPARPFRSSATEEPWLAPEPGARPRPADNFAPLPTEPPPRLAPELNVPRAPRVDAPAPRAPTIPPVAAEPAQAAGQADHNLAEMALQLEAALRRAPAPEGRPPVTDPLAGQVAKPAEPRLREFKPRVEPKFEPKAEPKFEPKFEPKAEAKPEPKFDLPKFEPKQEPKLDIKPEPKAEPPQAGKNLYDNLEEEMASLLGRPSGKP